MRIIERIIEAVRAVAAERPDFEYHRAECAYWVRNIEGERTCDCIFGHAMDRIPSPNNTGQSVLFDIPPEFNSDNIAKIFDYLGLEVTESEAAWCMKVQRMQDGGYPWGACIEAADAEVSSLA